MGHLFQFHPSRIFSTLLVAVFLLTILVSVVLPLVLSLKVLLIFILLCALTYYLLRYARLLLPSSIVAMHIEAMNVVLHQRNGNKESGRILSGSLVTPLLVVLNVFQDRQARTCSVILFADSLHKEPFRELRVILSWGGTPQQ